jgi:hypothetical protein
MPGLGWDAQVIATIALSASSVLLGLLLPLAAGLTIVGVVVALVDRRWRMLVAGLLLTIAVVAAGVFLRAWGAQQAPPEQLALPNQTAAIVFTAVTPLGVVIGVVLVVVALVRRYVGRRRG